MSEAQQIEKKGHICPPSNAKHPSDRWESLFVYSFICKFTNLRSKVEGLETPMDVENSLLSCGPDPILSTILQQFILNLRPQTRNLSVDQISSTLSNVLAEAFKGSERTVFWDDQQRTNVDPFATLTGGIFTADWDLKLKVLRQLVELQLQHSAEIKGAIDRAWGVTQNKFKKRDLANAPPDASDTKSRENLQLIPLGQDCTRKRYWILDDSPRIYVSTNPWKVTATFQAVSSSREQYLAVIEKLKASLPQGKRKSKIEQAHIALIQMLETRIDVVDAELARVQRVRRKIEQRQFLMAQAEIRETRTRRQARRPDYVYNDVESGEDDTDEYAFEQDDDDDDDAFGQDDGFCSRPDKRSRRRLSSMIVQRRSTRPTRGKRPSPEVSSNEWKGERRSTRLGTSEDAQLDRPPKRARTEESTTSSGSVGLVHPSSNGSSRPRTGGAAAVRPTEIAVEQVGGKKKSKYWFYAVEPIPSPAVNGQLTAPDDTTPIITDGHSQQDNMVPTVVRLGQSPAGHEPNQWMNLDRHINGSLSPLPEKL